MTTYTAQQRFTNIIQKAINNGYEIDLSESFEEVYFQAEVFLLNQDSEKEEFCEIHGNRNRQHIAWSDGMGYEHESDGEICDYSLVEVDENCKKFPHTKVVDSEGTVIQLFDKQDFSYDIHFNDSENSNNKGFKDSLADCKEYIATHNGSNYSYFADYKGGTVSIVCNETEEVVFETVVK